MDCQCLSNSNGMVINYLDPDSSISLENEKALIAVWKSKIPDSNWFNKTIYLRIKSVLEDENTKNNWKGENGNIDSIMHALNN